MYVRSHLSRSGPGELSCGFLRWITFLPIADARGGTTRNNCWERLIRHGKSPVPHVRSNVQLDRLPVQIRLFAALCEPSGNPTLCKPAVRHSRHLHIPDLNVQFNWHQGCRHFRQEFSRNASGSQHRGGHQKKGWWAGCSTAALWHRLNACFVRMSSRGRFGKTLFQRPTVSRSHDARSRP